MRKNYTVTTLIFTVLVVVLAIFTYTNYLEPMLRNSKVQEREYDLSDRKPLTIYKDPSQGKIHSIEIEINGQSNKNFDIGFVQDDEIMHDARVKGGVVSFYYITDWHSDSVELLFDGGNELAGKIMISTRFVSLD